MLEDGYTGVNITNYNLRIGEIWVNGVKKTLSAVYGLTSSWVYGGLYDEIQSFYETNHAYPTQDQLEDPSYFTIYFIGLHAMGNQLTIFQNKSNPTPTINGINIFSSIG